MFTCWKQLSRADHKLNYKHEENNKNLALIIQSLAILALKKNSIIYLFCFFRVGRQLTHSSPSTYWISDMPSIDDARKINI